MVLGIQVAGFLFGLFMLYYSYLQYKRKEFSINEFGFWIGIWIIFVVISLFPNVLDPIVKNLAFARTFDLLVISGFILIIGMTFYIYTLTKKNSKQIETVVREIALRKKK
jgi:hypothetical protein